MAFTDWEKFQTLATKLAKGGDEAMFRSAVNRSYYAALQLSMNYAEVCLNGFRRNRSGDDHQRVIQCMLQSKNFDIKSAGRKLKRLQDNRRKADYDERISIIQGDADASVLMADEIITTLNSAAKNP